MDLKIFVLGLSLLFFFVSCSKGEEIRAESSAKIQAEKKPEDISSPADSGKTEMPVKAAINSAVPSKKPEENMQIIADKDILLKHIRNLELEEGSVLAVRDLRFGSILEASALSPEARELVQYSLSFLNDAVSGLVADETLVPEVLRPVKLELEKLLKYKDFITGARILSFESTEDYAKSSFTYVGSNLWGEVQLEKPEDRWLVSDFWIDDVGEPGNENNTRLFPEENIRLLQDRGLVP